MTEEDFNKFQEDCEIAEQKASAAFDGLLNALRPINDLLVQSAESMPRESREHRIARMSRRKAFGEAADNVMAQMVPFADRRVLCDVVALDSADEMDDRMEREARMSISAICEGLRVKNEQDTPFDTGKELVWIPQAMPMLMTPNGGMA